MDTPKNTKTVGIWIRVSTEDQAHGESPDHHERRARAYAEGRGWIVNLSWSRGTAKTPNLPECSEVLWVLWDIFAEREGAAERKKKGRD